MLEHSSGWRLFPHESGHRDVALLLCPNLSGLAAWWDCCYYGIAVFVLDGGLNSSRGVLYVTAHLPDRSETDDAYVEALKSLDDLFKKLPVQYEVSHRVLGVDANVELNGALCLEP